jgi:hypothetical protein
MLRPQLSIGGLLFELGLVQQELAPLDDVVF